MPNKLQEKGLWDKATDFLGGAWEGMSALDKLALASSPVPLVGDIIGGVADATNIGQQWMNTGEFPKTDAALALTGLLPFVPPMAATRGIKSGLKSMADKAVHHAPNYLPGFYGTGVAGQVAGTLYGAAQGGANMLKGAYSPKAQGMWGKHGVSLTDKKVAGEMLSKMNGTYKKTTIDKMEEFLTKNKKTGEKGNVLKNPDKKAMGQINQSRQFDEQYGNNSTFYKLLDGMDQKAFTDLSGEAYFKVMNKATGLNSKTLNAVFDEIKKVQNVDPKKKYRMAIRRPSTQSSGNLNNLKGQFMFGGKGLGTLKKAFPTGVGYKTNKDLVAGLEAQGIRIKNKDKVLKNEVPPIISGYKHTDAMELGGANYMTVVKKDGTIVTFLNDEHDLSKLKAPMADRLMAVTTPIHFDLLNKGTRSPAVDKALTGLRTEAQVIRDQVEETMSKIGNISSTDKIPKNTVLNRAQYATINALDKLDAPAAYAPVAANVALASGRAAKPLERGERNSSQRSY